MRYLSTIILLTLALAATLQAQQAQGGSAESRRFTEVWGSSINTVVKGAPFSAEAISESVQTLSDGNRITRSNTTKMFRDSEGRFRNEGSSSGGMGFSYTTGAGGLTSVYGFSETISIFDPVGKVRYILNPSSKTARQTSVMTFSSGTGFTVTTQSLSPAVKAQIEASGESAAAANKALEKLRAQQTESENARRAEVIALGEANVVVVPPSATTAVRGTGKTESLGTRNFEGVEAEGTRTITTIPAGAIGNERDIETVSERWYSKELQLVVYSRVYDPRFGEQTYRLVNINRSEPDRSLFQPPADYKIVTTGTYNVLAPTKAPTVQGTKKQ